MEEKKKAQLYELHHDITILIHKIIPRCSKKLTVATYSRCYARVSVRLFHYLGTNMFIAIRVLLK